MKSSLDAPTRASPPPNGALSPVAGSFAGPPPPASSPTAIVYVALVCHTVISGLHFLAAKRALLELDPLTVLLLRMALSSALFIALLACLPKPRFPPRATWGWLIVFGFLVGPINQGVLLFGLQHTRPTHGALFFSMTPAAVHLYSLARGREKSSASKLAGITLAFVGVLILLTGQGLDQNLEPLMGDLLVLAAVSAWVLFTAEGKRFAEQHGPLRTTAWSMLAGAAWSATAIPFARFDRLASASLPALGSIVYIGLFTSVVAYLLWYFALSRSEASKVAVFANLQPVVTALAAAAWLGEPLVWQLVLGGLLVLLGVRVAQARARRQP